MSGVASSPASGPSYLNSRLTIDLAALRRNYRRLRTLASPARCAVAVKADAYGLGIEAVGPTLWKAGAREFFVAHFEEALRLEAALAKRHGKRVKGRAQDGAAIYVLHGLGAARPADYRAEGFRPVLNSLADLRLWRRAAKGNLPPAALHIDTGMNRLGLTPGELAQLTDDPALTRGLPIALLMSHLASAEDPKHPANERQRRFFETARNRLPHWHCSLANSSGTFLGKPYHYDLVRCGAALYGVNPQPSGRNPMDQVVRLQGRILQIREIDAIRTVGYGADLRVPRGSRLATVAVGYADGYPRIASGKARARIRSREVPVVGRVSMDLITLDVTALPPSDLRVGDYADMIGSEFTVDDLGDAAGTIGYEVLTRLGHRFARYYRGA